ncbi:MAG: hypothetical protein LBT99_02785 [Bifidobacteriaceae bacterium]|jgi:transcriptional regulator with XRE-family HTH domain|nr:hypothetical protein [Bifidobacteriaceae bacterium]
MMDIRNYFKKNNITLKINDIAVALDISKNSVVLKNRHNNYKVDDLIKICNYINYSVTKALLDLDILKKNDVSVNSNIEIAKKTLAMQDLKTSDLLDELQNRLKELDCIINGVKRIPIENEII